MISVPLSLNSCCVTLISGNSKPGEYEGWSEITEIIFLISVQKWTLNSPPAIKQLQIMAKMVWFLRFHSLTSCRCFKVVVGNFVNELTLTLANVSCSIQSLGNNFAVAVCTGSHFILFVEPTDGVACRKYCRQRRVRGVRHEQLISLYRRHLLLKSAVLTGQSGQRVQRVHFSDKPSSRW